ncbi:MAG: hypothetical protein ACRELY_05535 [Polyangiaceae bacterium]
MVRPGADYALAYQIRVPLPGAGPSRAVALVTRRNLYMLPWVSISGGGLTIVRTTQTVGGMPPGDAIRQLVSDPSATPDTVDQCVTDWCGQLQGAYVKQLAVFKRVKIRTGFFTRSVVFSEKESGFDAGGPMGTAVGFRPAKDEVAAFEQLFANDPRRV